MLKHMKTLILSVLLVLAISGCSSRDAQSEGPSQASETPAAVQSSSAVSESTPTETPSQSAPDTVSSEDSSSADSSGDTPTPADLGGDTPAPTDDAPATSAGELTVHFGDDGAPFTMHLYDNPTAAAIAGYVGTADWRLPIYEYDGYDNWEVMQFYDLPSRYDIPSDAQTVATEKSGEVYYSEPNRIVLFYGDAEVTGEYTPVGYFDATAEFATAVSGNPVLEGWSNKIVLITE